MTNKPAATTARSRGDPGRGRVARRSGPGRARRLVPTVLAVLALFGIASLYRVALSPDADRGIGGRFRLTDDRGRAWSDDTLRGRFALLFFGYTGCADVCPTTLAVASEVLRNLDPDAKRVQPVFVTVDPSHDTPARLRDYVSRFSPTLIGLTGTPTQLDRVERMFQVTVRPDAEQDHDSLSHSAALYLLGPDGRFRAAIPADIDGAALDALLRRSLAGTG